MTAAVSGFLLSLGLILAIGAQNAFVLRQGIRREHVLAVCAVCSLSDALLIAGGVAGFGALIASVPWLAPVMQYCGAAFLLFYGLRSFWAAWQNHGGLNPAERGKKGLGVTLLTCLAFTWLNPHVYLDTFVLIGSVSTRYAGHRIEFAIGAMLASLIFFFSLGFGARLLGPVFANPRAWQLLDALIGVMMIVLSGTLLMT